MIGLQRLFISFVLIVYVGVSEASDPQRGSVTNADFFFYSCVHEYMKAHSIKLFDGSMAYAVEYMDAPAETIMTLHKAAKDFALTIRASDYSDPEHRLPAVLVLCKDKAKSYGEK